MSGFSVVLCKVSVAALFTRSTNHALSIETAFEFASDTRVALAAPAASVSCPPARVTCQVNMRCRDVTAIWHCTMLAESI